MQRAELKAFPGDEAVVRARAGDMEAFAQLYEAYFPAVYDFLIRLLRDPDEAADVTQDTFLKAMRSLSSLREPGQFRAWLFTIARNTALNRIAVRQRSVPLERRDDEEGPAFTVVDESRFADPAEAAAAKEAAAVIDEVAKALDPRQLSLLDLHLRQGLGPAEIAQVLGVSRNNAAVMLHRLREAVRRAIEATYLAKRPGCPRLAAALADVTPPLTPGVRRIVEKHADRCPECGERRKKLAPLFVFSALAPVQPPPGLAERLLAQLRTAAASGALGPCDDAVPQPEAPVRLHRRVSVAAAALGSAAVLLGLLAFVPGSPVSVFRTGLFDGPPDFSGALPFFSGNGDEPPTAGPAAPTPIRPPTASPTPTSTPAAAGAAAAPRSPTPTPTATPTLAPTPTPTPSPTPSPTPAPTPTPCVTEIAVEPNATLAVGPGTEWLGLLTIADVGGCGFAFRVIVVEGADWLVATPTSGVVTGTGQVQVSVVVDPARLPGTGEGLFTGRLRIDAGAAGAREIDVQVSNVGEGPRIHGVTAQCFGQGTVEGSGVVVTVTAADDFGITGGSVTLGETSIALTRVEESTWVGIITGLAPNVRSGLVRVFDGAGQSAQRAFDVSCGVAQP
ncbi:MAG: sigma-70 family RNA polymerase sigma factor [Chloroflexota bacterium]|nr:sigma-70 family RNA polymerase sigma factor [Dehalococcoidia bacterium]MDW8046604.1 sigma-70 family RNA polymerase sigma factor [Chloroflexota bacterium]